MLFKGNGETVNNCAACSTLLATVHRVKEEKKINFNFLMTTVIMEMDKKQVQHGVETATRINNNSIRRLSCATMWRYTVALVKLRRAPESRTPAMRFPPRGGSWLTR